MTNSTNSAPYRLLLETARLAIKQFVMGQPLDVPALEQSLNATQGVFVTLWENPKRLRGCIGRTQGITPSLTQEVAECAIMAATKDTRFKPLQDPREHPAGLQRSVRGVLPESPQRRRARRLDAPQDLRVRAQTAASFARRPSSVESTTIRGGSLVQRDANLASDVHDVPGSVEPKDFV